MRTQLNEAVNIAIALSVAYAAWTLAARMTARLSAWISRANMRGESTIAHGTRRGEIDPQVEPAGAPVFFMDSIFTTDEWKTR